MYKKLAISLLVAVGTSASIHAAAIAWGAAVDNGFSLANGSELPAGNLARLGLFSLSDSEITAAAGAGNIALLNSSFTEVGSSRIGSSLGAIDGHFIQTSNFPNTTPGRQLYFWVFDSTNNSDNAASINSAVQIGIFKMDMAVNSRWMLPVDTQTPGTTDLDISDLAASASTLRAGASILAGSFPKGTSTATNAPNFGLAPVVVPEPGTFGLLSLTALGFLARRRSK